jgi:hypothetical protein
MIKLDPQKQGQCGSLSIGDYSYYTSVQDLKTNTHAWLVFSQGNYYVDIRVADKKDKGLNEAIRIGNIIKSRLQ